MGTTHNAGARLLRCYSLALSDRRVSPGDTHLSADRQPGHSQSNRHNDIALLDKVLRPGFRDHDGARCRAWERLRRQTGHAPISLAKQQPERTLCQSLSWEPVTILVWLDGMGRTMPA